MKQSDRLRYVKEYQSNPLRKEYENKKNIICSNKPFIIYLIDLGNLFFFVMFIFYGWVFFSSDNVISQTISNFISNTLVFYFLDVLLIIDFGIGNIAVGCMYFMAAIEWKKKIIEKHNWGKLEKLNNEYRVKGLYPIDASELFKHSCCEYDDVYEMTVCSITKRIIGYSDLNYCNTPGNCRKCKTFMKAYMGDDWNGEYNHEYK